MRFKRFLLTVGIALLFGAISAGGFFLGGIAIDAQDTSNTTLQDVIEQTLAIRRERLREEPDASLPDESEINVLLLGLDSRKEDLHPHCDAIHMFSLNIKDWTIHITSVPRGTYAYIPTEKINWDKFDPANFPPPSPEVNEKMEGSEDQTTSQNKQSDSMTNENTAETTGDAVSMQTTPVETQPPWDPKAAYIANQSYLSNSCALVGMDYGIEQIEKVVGKQADYIVTVGFSQTLGFLRFLGLPTTESLQFLRHRQGYAIGDPQRSHNQALFMKDLIINHGQRLKDSLNLPLERVLFSLVNTNMEFATAHTLLHGFLDAEIYQDASRITLSMKPHHETEDYHFDPDNPTEHLDVFLKNVAPRLSEEDFSNMSIAEIQDQLIGYIKERLDSGEPVADLIDKRIWLQIEDPDARERIHFDLVSLHIKFLQHKNLAEDFLTSYILEKETLGLPKWADKGKELLHHVHETWTADINAEMVII